MEQSEQRSNPYVTFFSYWVGFPGFQLIIYLLIDRHSSQCRPLVIKHDVVGGVVQPSTNPTVRTEGFRKEE